MSSSDGAVPPAAVPPAPTAPVKVPVKIAAKIPLGNFTVKVPVGITAPGALGGKFASVLPTRGAAPLFSNGSVVAAPPKPAAPKPEPRAPPVKRPRLDEEDDDDLAKLGGRQHTTTEKPKAARPVVKREPAPRPAPIVKKTVLKREYSSDDDSEKDEESVSLFARASQKGLVPVGNEELLQDDEETVVQPGIPPRPPIQKFFPSDLDAMIERLKKKVAAEDARLRIKDDNKTISLSTSKVNYIDPRIVCAWCKREKMAIGKVFAASLQKKFPWAMNTSEDYEF